MPVSVLIQMLEAGKSVLGKVKAVVTCRAIAQGEQVAVPAAGPSDTAV